MKQILVIEDDPLQRELFKNALEDGGYAVFEAEDGEIGFEVFRKHPCDLVITDIFMPNEEGFRTIYGLKVQYPTVKVIAVSGGAMWTDGGDIWARYHGTTEAGGALELAKEFGADYTMRKPVEIFELLNVVDRMLR